MMQTSCFSWSRWVCDLNIDRRITSKVRDDEKKGIKQVVSVGTLRLVLYPVNSAENRVSASNKLEVQYQQILHPIMKRVYLYL